MDRGDTVVVIILNWEVQYNVSVRPATFGTGIVLAVVGIFMGSAIIDVIRYFSGNMTRYMGVRAEVPWWSDFSAVVGDVGRYYAGLAAAIAGLLLAVAILIEWYVASKNVS